MADQLYDDTEDKRLTEQAVKLSFSSTLLRAWDACRFTYRTFTHANKVFVIWEVADMEPRILGSIRIMSPSLCRFKGFGLDAILTVKGVNTNIHIGHKPTAVYLGKVFMWIPFNVTAKFIPKNDLGVHTLHIPVVVRQAAKPWDPEYGIRLTQQSEFKVTYPQFRSLSL